MGETSGKAGSGPAVHRPPPTTGRPMKSYLSAKQVVARLNGAVSVKTVYKLVGQGKLRSNRKLGKLLIEEDSLVELLEGDRPAPPPVPEELPAPARPRGRPRKKSVLDLW